MAQTTDGADNKGRVLQDITLETTPEQIRFGNRVLSLILDRKSGRLLRVDAPGVATGVVQSAGSDAPTARLLFDSDRNWEPRFLFSDTQIDAARRSVTLCLTIGLFPNGGEEQSHLLSLYYTLFPSERRVEIRAECTRASEGEAERFQGFEFSLPGVNLGAAGETAVHVPGPFWPKTYFRPGTSVAELKGVERSFHGAPDGGFGVISLHNSRINAGVITWMDCGAETNYHPSLKGDGERLTLNFRDHRQYYLRTGMTVSSDVLRLEIVPGSLSDTLKRHQIWAQKRLPLDGKTPDWVRQAVILEVYPKYFKRGFVELTEKLSFYRKIGVNTLYLMPHWKGGYSPLDLFAVEPSYGTKQELKALTKRAHELGMRVLFDMVIHGFGEASKVPAVHPEIFIHSPTGDLERHPTWKSVSTDWASPAYQEYMVTLVEQDLREYDIDGYRVDAASYKGPSWATDNPNPAYRSGTAAAEVMEMMLTALRRKKSDAVLLSEVFGPVFYTVCNFAHDNQTEAVQSFIEEMDRGNRTAADYKAHLADVYDLLPSGANRVYYARNHDTSWFYHFNGYTPRFMAFEAIHACCAIPEIFAGDPDNPHNPDDDPKIYDQYRRLFALRQKYPELAAGDLLLREVQSDNPMVFTALRRLNGKTVLILISLSNRDEITNVIFSDAAPKKAGTLRLFDPQGEQGTESAVAPDQPLRVTVKPFQTLIGRL